VAFGAETPRQRRLRRMASREALQEAVFVADAMQLQEAWTCCIRMLEV